MLSCDTIAISATGTEYEQNMLAKNSDRPTGESQSLKFFPARKSTPGTKLKMTDLEIDEVAQTYATVGSQPYWTWGFEMGYNECGLIIGNEAQGSKNAKESDTGILGLDLLRLGLERAATARDAIGVITDLLKKYGQNANASQLIDRRYENAYLLVDKNEIWLLETAGREWAAKRIEDRVGISNCYIIGEDFDLSSEKAEGLARSKRWLAPDEPFNFAKAYTMPAVRQTLSVPRMRRLNKLLSKKTKHGVASVKEILRDHFSGEITEERFGASSGTFFSICMHMREWGESETTASLISRIDDKLGVVSRWSPAQPCMSVYLPVYFTGYIPKCLSVCDKVYSDESLWWRFKRLALILSIDERFANEVHAPICELESEIERLAREAEKNAADLISIGKEAEAHAILNATMDKAVEMASALCDCEFIRVKKEIESRGGIYGPQSDNIKKYCEYTKTAILD